ncbi:MAG TPA: hypothetical protein DCW41_05285, partial [Clostridiales bacterium]|nr:hypothetical protein [Clostridiales bacterium]
MKKSNARKYILSIITCFSVAFPIVGLPLGVREGTSPALLVRRAYADTYPEEEVEEEPVVEDEEVDTEMIDYLMSGGTISATYNEGYQESSEESEYS